MEKHKDFYDIVKKVLTFNDSRHFSGRTHSEFAKSIVIEAAELLEHFQWSESADTAIEITPEKKVEIGLEMADVLWYLITLANDLDINLLDMVEKKLKHVEKKYPLEAFKDDFNKEAYYSRKKDYRKHRQSTTPTKSPPGSGRSRGRRLG